MQHAASSHTHTIIAHRFVHAPIADIWAAFSDPLRLEHWFTSEAQQDFQVGGSYRNGDGDHGEFLEIIPYSKIRFTWEQEDYEPGSTVSVDFSPSPNGEPDHWAVQVTHMGIACDDQSDLEIGWNWALDSLVNYLQTGLGLAFEEWAAMRGMI